MKVEFAKEPEPMPEELGHALDRDTALKAAWEALTPGRQRGYILHISSAKQTKTRHNRIKKWIPHILKGKGMHDRD
ncbi:MAG: YdeI/OmpD-associated family protein [Puniceicoccales bacterium]